MKQGLILPKAYDSHCNLVLGDVEETIYAVDENDEDEEVKVRKSLVPPAEGTGC